MSSFRPAHFIGQAFKGIWRNKHYTFTTMLVLIGCLIIFGSTYLIYQNVDYNMDKLGFANEIIVFLNSDTDQETVDAIGERIKALDNVDSENVIYISKAQALEEEADKYTAYGDLYDILEGDNPFRDSFEIPYINTEGVSTLVYQLNQIEEIEKINNRLDLANNIESLKNGILFVIIVFMIILIIVCVFVIVNTIGLTVMARSDEIVIMRYIGATGTFIAMPFIFEGVIIGAVSSIAAFFAQSFAYNYLIEAIGNGTSILSFCPFSDISSSVFWIFLGIGLLCGVVGSLFSMEKYLKA